MRKQAMKPKHVDDIVHNKKKKNPQQTTIDPKVPMLLNNGQRVILTNTA